MLIVLFGGTSFAQVGWTFAVTALTALAAGSLGATVALWREKTFQSLALVAMLLAAWLGLAEAAIFLNLDFAGMNTRELGLIANPVRVVVAASRPTIVTSWASTALPFLVVAAVVTVGLCSLAILRVRRWNPSRDVRRGQTNETETAQAGIDVFTGKLSDEDKDQGAAIVSQSKGYEPDMSTIDREFNSNVAAEFGIIRSCGARR